MVEDSLFGGVDNDLHMLLLMAGVGRNVCDDGVVEEVQFAFAAFFRRVSCPDGDRFGFLSRDESYWFWSGRRSGGGWGRDGVGGRWR